VVTWFTFIGVASLAGRLGLRVEDCRGLFGLGAGDIFRSSPYFPGLRSVPAGKGVFEGVLRVETGADLFVFLTDKGLEDGGTEDEGSVVFERVAVFRGVSSRALICGSISARSS
jgi:hypothetical protein